MATHHLQDTALRYFYEVARYGSIADASKRLHVAASAISRQITGLEHALDTPLFERHPRGMVLTAAGEILAAHVRRNGLEAEKTMQDIQSLQGLRTGKVTIVSSQGLANELLPPLIVAFQEAHEGILFELNVAPPTEVTLQVRSGDADIGIKFSRSAEKDIRIEYRQPAPILALMRPDHPLAGARSLTLKQMSAHRIALPGASTIVRQMLDVACSAQALLLEPVLVSNNMTTLHNFVLHAGCIAVSGEVSVRHLVRAGKMVAIPIRDRSMETRDIEVQTLAGRTLPYAVQAFLDFMKPHLDESHDTPRARI